jgi:multidrug resistance efflux pump
MTDGNTYAINKYLDNQEDWDALQEVTADLEQAEARIEELEGKLSKSEALLAKAVEAERVYCANVVKHFYDNGFFTKPDDIINRTTLAELKGQEDE